MERPRRCCIPPEAYGTFAHARPSSNEISAGRSRAGGQAQRFALRTTNGSLIHMHHFNGACLAATLLLGGYGVRTVWLAISEHLLTSRAPKTQELPSGRFVNTAFPTAGAGDESSSIQHRCLQESHRTLVLPFVASPGPHVMLTYPVVRLYVLACLPTNSLGLCRNQTLYALVADERPLTVFVHPSFLDALKGDPPSTTPEP